MPKYCYFCEICKKNIEIIHSFNEKDIKCPECGNSELKRIYTNFYSSFKNKNENVLGKIINLNKEKIKQIKRERRKTYEELKND
jgi:putative FmdB family regulatory protein